MYKSNAVFRLSVIYKLQNIRSMFLDKKANISKQLYNDPLSRSS